MAPRESVELDKKWFSGDTDIPVNVGENLEAVSSGRPLNATLGKNGWDGNTVAGVYLELSSDNASVRGGQFFVRGQLSSDPGTIVANKLWERAANDLQVTFTFPHGGEFRFESGKLASEYLDGDCVKIAVERGEQRVAPEEWSQLGVTPFSLRLIAYLDKLSNKYEPRIKFNLLFYPARREEMEEISELVSGAAWPGVKILEGHAALFPKAPQGAWGCPVYPILCPGATLEAAPRLPPGRELRFAISQIMRTARLPVPCVSHGTMRRKWMQIQADADAYEERTPAVVWPAAPEPTQRTG
jgi:hypothetical protein